VRFAKVDAIKKKAFYVHCFYYTFRHSVYLSLAKVMDFKKSKHLIVLNRGSKTTLIDFLHEIGGIGD
jgi:hypothetical protein